jgi:apolipoprotein N-acyltransferase
MAAITGVLGLSFWVMLTNFVALRELWNNKQPRKGFLSWLAIALVPYLFGAGYFAFHMHEETQQSVVGKAEQISKVALVQTGLLPSQKTPLSGHLHEFLSPWVQWGRIFLFLKDCKEQNPSLIILPEYTVPFFAGQPVYDEGRALLLLKSIFGEQALRAIPPLQPPFSELRAANGKGDERYVSNAFFSQFLANFFQAGVVIGMEDKDLESERSYSAAHYYTPGNHTPGRYEKRVLVPLAEYLPFEWCRSLVKHYGITEFYTHGKDAKVFAAEQPFSLSICYEETFPDVVREGKIKGAELFINLTNDNWYPNSKLAKQHFDHGRLRAIENGTPLVRACNSGITAVVNARGQIMDQLQQPDGVLYANIPRYSFSTLYTYYGDSLIIGCSLGLLIGYCLFSRFLRRLPGRFSKKY